MMRFSALASALILAAVLVTSAAAAAPADPTPGRSSRPGHTGETPTPAIPPPPPDLYRPQVDVEADPDAFYAPTYYRERGLPANAGGFDAEKRAWIKPFREFAAGGPLRPTYSRHTVALLPLGDVDERAGKRIALVREFLSAYLALPARVLPAEPLVGRPARAVDVKGKAVRQCEANHLLRHMVASRRSADVFVCVGLSTADLYAADLDWPSVAHLAATGEGIAVCSLARTFAEFFGRESKPEGAYRERRLTFGMAADAACRAVGLTPCRKYYCVMNQARETSTREPPHLCPDCLCKLRWALGFDPIARYDALRTFYRKAGMPVEARWTELRARECREGLAKARRAGSAQPSGGQ